jgi:hypothetical protein
MEGQQVFVVIRQPPRSSNICPRRRRRRQPRQPRLDFGKAVEYLLLLLLLLLAHLSHFHVVVVVVVVDVVASFGRAAVQKSAADGLGNWQSGG